MDVWLDGEGLNVVEPVINEVVTRSAPFHGFIWQLYVGPVVFASVDDEGETQSLVGAQIAALLAHVDGVAVFDASVEVVDEDTEVVHGTLSGDRRCGAQLTLTRREVRMLASSEKARVLDKARRMVRHQWACVVAACGFLVLQVVFGGWWWGASIACAVVVGVIAVVHVRYVRKFERSLDAPGSGRSAYWKD